jgi:hypothetical protein
MYEVALYNTPLPSPHLVLLLCTLFRVVSLAKARANMGQHKKASYTPTHLVNQRYLTEMYSESALKAAAAMVCRVGRDP